MVGCVVSQYVGINRRFWWCDICVKKRIYRVKKRVCMVCKKNVVFDTVVVCKKDVFSSKDVCKKDGVCDTDVYTKDMLYSARLCVRKMCCIVRI